MKKNLQIASALAALWVLIGSAIICPAQGRKMVGGFRETSNGDETVVSAANFAVETQAKKDQTLKLVSIKRAERQIVAGSNYRLCLAVKSNEKLQQATATIYLNLQNKFSLSEWTPGDCDADKANQTIESAGANKTLEAESVSYKGKLEVGKLESLILYVGEESGDYAAFCFDNSSDAGRAVLAACKAGEQCEFVGKVDFESSCEVKNLKANLSASAKITAIESVKSLAHSTSAMVKTSAVSQTATTPDGIVKNLYAAQKTKSGPFFQTKDRARVDRYFTKDFADLIWKDAITANGEVGALEFDPLYAAQDVQIKNFVVGKPEYNSNSSIVIVLVSFKNFGKAETIKFLLEQNAAKSWRITDIVYQNGDMLKGILFAALRDQTVNPTKGKS